MTEKENAIERTKSRKGFKVSITGISSRISNSRGKIDSGQKYMLGEFGKHFLEARQGWLEGNLDIVADFFGIYV